MYISLQFFFKLNFCFHFWQFTALLSTISDYSWDLNCLRFNKNWENVF